MNKDNKKLIAKLKAGDEEALRELIDMYKGFILSMILQYEARWDAILDLESEIFTKVWNNIDVFDSNKSSLSTWIARITHNHLVNYIRSKKKHSEIVKVDNDVITYEDFDALKQKTKGNKHYVLLKFYLGENMHKVMFQVSNERMLYPQHNSVIVNASDRNITYSYIADFVDSRGESITDSVPEKSMVYYPKFFKITKVSNPKVKVLKNKEFITQEYLVLKASKPIYVTNSSLNEMNINLKKESYLKESTWFTKISFILNENIDLGTSAIPFNMNIYFDDECSRKIGVMPVKIMLVS